MNKEVKKDWIAALRSGKYQQGKKALRSIIDPCKWEERAIDYTYDGLAGTLTSDLKCSLGIGHFTPGILIAMNDDDGNDFNAIADWIEENL